MLFDKIKLKFILNHQSDIINFNQSLPSLILTNIYFY